MCPGTWDDVGDNDSGRHQTGTCSTRELSGEVHSTLILICIRFYRDAMIIPTSQKYKNSSENIYSRFLVSWVFVSLSLPSACG